MKKLLLLSFLWITLAPCCRSQFQPLWETWHDSTLSSEARLDALYNIIWDGYLFVQPDSAELLAGLGYEFASSTDEPSMMAGFARMRGISFIIRGQHEEGLTYFDQSMRISMALGDSSGIAGMYLAYGNVQKEQGKLGDARQNYEKALDFFGRYNDGLNVMTTLGNLGMLAFEQADMTASLDYFDRLLRLAESYQNPAFVADAHHGIGRIQEWQNELDNALSYFEKSLAFNRSAGLLMKTAADLNSIGNVYVGLKDFDKAKDAYLETLQLHQMIGNRAAEANTYGNLGIVAEYLQDYDQALQYARLSLDISRELGMTGTEAGSLNQLSSIYHAKGEYQKALEYGLEAIKMARELEMPRHLLNASEALYKTYKSIGNYQLALDMSELNRSINDSIVNNDNQAAVIQQEIDYEYEKKALADSLSYAQESEIKDLQIQRQRAISVAIGGGLLSTLFLALFVASRLRITRRQKRMIEKQKQRAERSEKYKEQFLANMSHEIRTPMHAIAGMTKILKRNPHDPSQDIYLDAIDSSADNLLVIVNDILDLTKVESGKLHFENISMDPSSVMENVQSLLRYKAEEKGIALSWEVSDNIPDRVMGDPTRLHQVLTNLVGNAIKFTNKGNVHFKVERDDTSLRYSVSDTGVGIPLDKQDHIFRYFEQADDSTTRQFGGTGLGLSISKQLVQLQGGHIGLQSEPGNGSTFYFTLPLEVPDADADEHHILSEDQLMAMAADLKGIRVLLAEDNEFNLMIAMDDLTHYFSDVHIDVATDGRQAVEHLKNTTYDIVLMDVQMPEVNGYEATRLIRDLEAERGNGKRVPIIAMTASLLKTEIVQCFEAGMDDYIPKPYELEQFIGTIHQSIDNITSS